MDFELSEEDKKFRQEVRDFLNREVTQDLIQEAESGRGFGPLAWEFMKKLGAKGWVAPSMSKEHGGIGATHLQRILLEEELWYSRAIAIAMMGASMVAPTLQMYGNEEQKKEFITPIARGDVEFALGYSEPQAGSDMASLEIRAVKDGDHYILNGQKIYNTSMHYAQYVWLAARTNPNVPKHKGISLFIVDIKTPGITIRPLIAMCGERTNEVFYDDVRVPAKNLVGEENKGWHYINTALVFERNFVIARIRRGFDDLVEYCKETKHDDKLLIKDPIVRQTLAQLKIDIEAAQLLMYRVAWMADQKIIPEWQAPMIKVFGTELMKRLGSSGIQIMGLYGLLEEDSKWRPLKWSMERMYRQACRRTITMGTSEIQRNIIALRGLGLPRS